MNSNDPLEESLLDLHALLGDRMPLIVGGGYGLFSAPSCPCPAKNIPKE